MTPPSIPPVAPPKELPPAPTAPAWFEEWTALQWLMLIVCVLLLALLTYIIVRVIIHRIRLNRMVGTMREDLLLRRELAAMAAGKDIAAQQKEQFMRTESIRMDMHAAAQDMEEHGISPRRTGSWILLGEPGSGKSRLMESGGIHYPMGMNDFSRASEPTSTFNLWITEKGSVWDVGGRLFLSRWGGRQDQEWRFFLSEYKKIYRKSLPSGVILTIPADALLLDSADLREKKTTLIVEEMRALCHTLGAHCPVWVVITKCDLVDGFSEFFSLLDDPCCDQPLGWKNPEADSSFNQSKTSAAFDGIVNRLKDLRSALALNAQLWEKAAAPGANRADIATPIYLMPERFAAMRENLCSYLSAIFTHIRDKEDDRGLFRFEGFWFVATLDKPVTTTERVSLEKEGGKLHPVVLPQKAPQDHVAAADASDLISVHEKILSVASPRHYFTKNLWQEGILCASGLSRYTARALQRIRRPYWISTLILLALAIPLVITSHVKNKPLETLADRDVNYWKEIHRLFTENAVSQAALISAEKDRQVPLAAQDVPTTHTSRREFMYTLSNMTTLSAELPLFWRPAAWWVDDETSITLFSTYKNFIDKASLVSMLVKPVVDSARSVLSYRADHHATLRSPWEPEDTKALATLLQISRHGVLRLQGVRVYDDIPYAHLINLKDSPSQDSALKSLWMNSTSKNKTIHDMSQLNGYLKPVSMESALALSKGTALYSHAVLSLDIYPNLHFRLMHRFLQELSHLMELRDAMRRMEENFAQAERQGDSTAMRSSIREWISAYQEALPLVDSLRAAEKELDIDDEASLRDCVTAVQKALYDALTDDIKNFDAIHIGLGNSDNANFLKEQATSLRKAINTALPRIASECDPLVTKELCLFWDRKEDETSTPHPWENFMASARDLYELFTYPVPAGSRTESFHRRLTRIQETKKEYDTLAARVCKQVDTPLNEACWEQNWHILERIALHRCLADAPRANIEVPLSTAPLNGRKFPAMPYTHAGRASINQRYEPMSANRRITDLTELSAYVHERFPDDQSDDDLYESVTLLDEACKHYLLDYILYWTEMVPSQYKIQGIRTWLDFVESGDVLFAADMPGIIYEVNSLLIEALSISCLQDETKYPEVIERLANVRQVQKDLNAEARRNIGQTAHFISKLPRSADEAWISFLNTPVDKLFGTYWTAWYPNDTNASFLWWNDYLEHGMLLLKHEAAAAEQESLLSVLAYTTKFPLCNTPLRERSDILSLYDLIDMGERLEAISQADGNQHEDEIAKQAAARNIPEDLASLRLPLLLKNGHAWKPLSDTLALLASPEAPLTYELILPASAARAASITGEDNPQRLIPAGYRFSYCRISCKGSAITNRFALNKHSETDTDISSAPMPADMGDLQFEFYRHSNSTTPDSVLKIDGAWSALNLYLRPGVRLSDDKKTAYVPTIFRDREGYSCIFWLGLRFNREMIPPSEWPSYAAFDTPTSGDDQLMNKELAMRKAIRHTFLTARNIPRKSTPEERSALLRELASLLGSGYKISFEVITPSATECPDPERLEASSAFPYFTVGSALASSSKLRAVPDATQHTGFQIPGDEKLLLRLYRHAQEEFSALYLQQEEPLLHYVIKHASGFSPIAGFFSVPFRASNGTSSATYTLYLRPRLTAAADDGLLPDDAAFFPNVDYPEPSQNEIMNYE